MIPKVNIGVLGRFHGFDLAEQLEKHGYLKNLITSYPRFKVRQWQIPSKRIKNNLRLEIFNRINAKTRSLNILDAQSSINSMHANFCKKYLKECDVFIGWSGSSLESIKHAKNLDKITILERGSTHYSFQVNILNAEYRRLGIKPPKINKSVWSRELEEYELCDYISVSSDFAKKTFTDQGIQSTKIIVNPYGVNLRKFNVLPKKDNIFRIVFVGTASIRKGFHLLIEAFNELKLANAELVHIGTVDKDIRSILKKDAFKKVIFKGYVQQDKLINQYSQGSVFILPSIEEGLAMVQLQAMACGLPLICTENSGGKMLIEHNKEGLIIEAGNKDAIKNSILKLYENPEIVNQMSRAAEEKARSRFSWNDYGERYVENLKFILRKNVAQEIN